MKKTICDLCGGDVGASVVAKFLTAGVQLQCRAGDQDVCKYCMIDAFKKLDDRPAPQPSEIAEQIRKVLNGYPYGDGNPWPLDLLGKAADALTSTVLQKEPPSLADDTVSLAARGARPVHPHAARWFVHPETGEVLKANTAKSPLKITPRTPTPEMVEAGREAKNARSVDSIWQAMWEVFNTVAAKPEEPDPILHVPFGGGL